MFSKRHSLYFCSCIHIAFHSLLKYFTVACQDGAHISHTTATDFKGIFIKYVFEFMTVWKMPPNFGNCLPTLLFTLLEYGGLNQILFRFCLFFSYLPYLSTSSLTYSRFSWNPIFQCFLVYWKWLLKYLFIGGCFSNSFADWFC